MTDKKEYIWNLSDLKTVKKNGLKVFSCFSCGGGSSMGYKLAGFDVIGNNEIDTKINNIYVKNLNPKYTFNCDIRDMSDAELPEELNNIDILDGSPPCSAFSISGLRENVWGVAKKFKEGQKKQRLDDLFFPFLDFANRIKPKVIIAENVRGIIQKYAKGYINKILNKLENMGYETQIFLLNSAVMGVPQTRERVFFISCRKDLNFPKIQLKFNEKPIIYGEFRDKENFISINKNMRAYYYWTRKIFSDKSVGDTINRLEGKRKRYSERYLKDNNVFPCVTTTVDGFLLQDIPARPSVKDVMTAQTFPQDYDFNGGRNGSKLYLLSMSVPPLMMKKISEQVYLQFFKNNEVRSVQNDNKT